MFYGDIAPQRYPRLQLHHHQLWDNMGRQRLTDEQYKRKKGGLLFLLTIDCVTLAYYSQGKGLQPGHQTFSKWAHVPITCQRNSHIMTIVAYVLPSDKATTVCDIIYSVTVELQVTAPQHFHCDIWRLQPYDSLLHKWLTSHSWLTVQPETIEAWIYYMPTLRTQTTPQPSPPLARSNHNLVHFSPQYKPLVQQQPASTKIIRRWSQDAIEALRGCFESMDWKVLTSFPKYLQLEPEMWKGAHTLKNIMPGRCGQEGAPEGLKCLQTSGINITQENPGEVGPLPPQIPGQTPFNPPAVCLPGTHQNGGWHHLPST